MAGSKQETEPGSEARTWLYQDLRLSPIFGVITTVGPGQTSELACAAEPGPCNTRAAVAQAEGGRKRYIVIDEDSGGHKPHRADDLGLGSVVRLVSDAGLGGVRLYGVTAGLAIGNAVQRAVVNAVGNLPTGVLRDISVEPISPRKSEFGSDIELLHSTAGASLIEASQDAIDELRNEGKVVAEDTPIYPASARPAAVRRRGVRTNLLRVTIESETTGNVVAGAQVTAKLVNGDVDSDATNEDGVASIDVTGSAIKMLWIDEAPGHWSWTGPSPEPVSNGVTVRLMPIDAGYVDVLRHHYEKPSPDAGIGVKVAVIDTGIGPHPDVAVAGGLGYPASPGPGEYTASGSSHGTHVAGIIKSSGAWFGVAPGVSLYSYRVYEDLERGSAYALAVAIDEASRLGCDIINLSIVCLPNDAVRRYIQYALDRGVIIIAAAGNDDRSALSFPASVDGVIAVGAVGRRGTFPLRTSSAKAVAAPAGTDPDDFVASFSNRVRSDDFSAPGVGVISSLTGGGWGVMDGTSMAAPVITGLVSRTLASSQWSSRPRSVQRTRAILSILRRRAASLGFPVELQGKGLVKSP